MKETKRQGRIAHHHTDATVPHIVALPGFSFHVAKIGISLQYSKQFVFFSVSGGEIEIKWARLIVVECETPQGNIQILVISNIKNGSGFSKFPNPLFFNMLFL